MLNYDLEELEKRVFTFEALSLRGQMPMMHMGTAYLVADLFRALKMADEVARKRCDTTTTTESTD